jgi:hypothetical protein
MSQDSIHQLETDESTISDKDQYTLNMIFNQPKIEKDYQLQQILISSLLFFILSLPKTDELIQTFTKIQNTYIKLMIKITLFIAIYFTLLNYVVKQ